MSRVTTLEKMYRQPQKDALEFDYDSLWAPPIYSILSYEDVQELYKIATSVKLSANVNRKYQLLDAIMERRGFRPDHKGTNRVTYRFLEDPRFIAKVAVDRVGIKDSPAEFKNQEYLKPFCCKIFEVDPTGVIAFVERVNPITSLEEFASVSDDIFNMMITKVIGKYVVDDLGTTKFMNYGIRMRNGCSFGPVVIDFPYIYELDGAKLLCKGTIKGTNQICGGEIDYDAGMNHLVCKRCGREYSAKELKKDETLVLKMYGESDRRYTMRARVINADGTVIMDSGRSASKAVSKEEMKEMSIPVEFEPVSKVSKTHVNKTRKRRESPLDVNRRFQRERIAEYEKKVEAEKLGPFNPVIKPNSSKVSNVRKSTMSEDTMQITEPVKIPTVTSVPVSVIHVNEEAIRLAIPELNNRDQFKFIDKYKDKLLPLGIELIGPDAISFVPVVGEADDYPFAEEVMASMIYRASDAYVAGNCEESDNIMQALIDGISSTIDNLSESDSDGDNVDIADVIVDTINEAIQEDNRYEYTEEDDDMNKVDDTSVPEEPDYSDYEPDEYEDDVYEDEDDEYQEYADRFEREERKQNRKRRKVDMSEY